MDQVLTDEAVQRFALIFSGLERAYGGTEGLSIKEPLTLAVYRAHLEGRRSVGVYPLRDDATVWFAAIDFDRKIDKVTKETRTPEEIDRVAFEDAEAVATKLEQLNIDVGVFLERSKSKGAHLWVFFDRPAPAADVRRLLQHAYDSAVGARPSDPKVEIFPKQDKLNDRADFGNYINLPYPDALKPLTYRVVVERHTHEPMPFDAFVDLVHGGSRFPTSELAKVITQIPQPKTTPGQNGSTAQGNGKQNGKQNGNGARLYPCTLGMLQHGLQEGGGRNQFGFLLSKRLHVGGFSGADGYKQFEAWNFFNTPPLDPDELRLVWDQGAKYSSMGCDDEHVLPFCKTSCPIHPNNKNAGYSRLLKELTQPPRYVLTVNGFDVKIKGFSELWNHTAVRNACGEQYDELIPAMKKDAWDERLRELLQSIEHVPVPEVATQNGLIWESAVLFLKQRVLFVDDPEGYSPAVNAIEREGWIYVRGELLLTQVEGLRKMKVKPELLWTVVKEHGGISVTKRFAGQLTRVWGIPLDVVKAAAGEIEA